jgi:hypothetical protein
VLNAGFVIAAALLVSSGGASATPGTKDREVRIDEVRVPPKIFEIPRGVSTIVDATCRENGLGLYVEIAKGDAADYWDRRMFSPSSTFRDVIQYLQSRGLSCAMRGSTMVVRNSKLDRLTLDPLDVPFSQRAFKATTKEIADGIMAASAGAGMGSYTGGVKGADDGRVYSFSEGECETLRDLFLAIAKRGGRVFTSVNAGSREAPTPLLYFVIN